LEKHDYLVHAGVCNVDNNKWRDSLCITKNLPHPIKIMKASTNGTEPKQNLIGWRCYMWFLSDHDFGDESIQSVYFSGFAAQFISRKVIETVKFIDDSTVNRTPNITGGCLDVMFSNKMFQLNIPQMVDTRIRMKHLRNTNDNPVELVGDGEARFYPANEDNYDLIYAEPKGIKRKWMMRNGKVIGQAK